VAGAPKPRFTGPPPHAPGPPSPGRPPLLPHAQGAEEKGGTPQGGGGPETRPRVPAFGGPCGLSIPDPPPQGPGIASVVTPRAYGPDDATARGTPRRGRPRTWVISHPDLGETADPPPTPSTPLGASGHGRSGPRPQPTPHDGPDAPSPPSPRRPDGRASTPRPSWGLRSTGPGAAGVRRPPPLTGPGATVRPWAPDPTPASRRTAGSDASPSPALNGTGGRGHGRPPGTRGTDGLQDRPPPTPPGARSPSLQAGDGASHPLDPSVSRSVEHEPIRVSWLSLPPGSPTLYTSVTFWEANAPLKLPGMLGPRHFFPPNDGTHRRDPHRPRPPVLFGGCP